MANELRGDHIIDVGDRLQDALAAVAGLVAVAQFDCLVGTGRCAGWYRRGHPCAVCQCDEDPHCRVAARVQDFKGVYRGNACCHGFSPRESLTRLRHRSTVEPGGCRIVGSDITTALQSGHVVNSARYASNKRSWGRAADGTLQLSKVSVPRPVAGMVSRAYSRSAIGDGVPRNRPQGLITPTGARASAVGLCQNSDSTRRKAVFARSRAP